MRTTHAAWDPPAEREHGPLKPTVVKIGGIAAIKLPSGRRYYISQIGWLRIKDEAPEDE